MDKKTFGVFAHVDAGKTSFSEQLLFHAGVIRNPGRVDHKNTVLDAHDIERQRGITIFSDQARFFYEDTDYYLIDTPGHIDFSAEAERMVACLDYAILIISGKDGVQAHSNSLFRLFEKYNIPVFIFINKIDIETFFLEEIIKDIKSRLTEDVIYIPTDSVDRAWTEEESVLEFLSERDEDALQLYLEDNLTKKKVIEGYKGVIKDRKCFPITIGSALKDIGIKEFLSLFHSFTDTDYSSSKALPFTGRVYKIRHDNKGNRITYLKALIGTLKPKDEFTFNKEGEEYSEKINEIRIYTGSKYESISEASAGDIIAVTGLKTPNSGDYLGTDEKSEESFFQTALESKVSFSPSLDKNQVLSALKLLEAEDPMLGVYYEKELDSIKVNLMGKIQLEVLKEIIKDRFGFDVDFEKPEVLYRETIASQVMGYGHYEPLRHYAEVNIRLEPSSRGSGITFESQCHVDVLPTNYQSLIRTHIFEKKHKGILTGFPITDINIVLTAGRAHLKHTEGGDFREATYRAIRQGLEKADNVLLEPYYSFDIYAPSHCMGRIISDIQRMNGSCEINEASREVIHIHGRGPVASFMDYQGELLAITKGMGSIAFIFDGYDLCHNREEVIERIAYDKGADKENTSASVFCVKGAGFLVNWDEAEKYMHCIGK